ncbi:hypothetical protein G9A89_014476 [Geosiphon pyriformis]|nr:hypothetical protein G9A89_014476 [Geosiphon pyriformis]
MVSKNPITTIFNPVISQCLKNRIFNKLYFLKVKLHNAAVNEQKAITAIYIKAKVEKKQIHLILDSGSVGSIITYQLIQQLGKNVDRLVQTVIFIANGIKKTLVGEIDNFLFTIDGIIIPVKVLVMDVPQYQALKFEKALVFEFEKKKELPIIETFMAFESPFNWAEETEQKIFEETRRWNVVRYSIPEPQKQLPYIPLKYKDYMLLEEYNWINVAMKGGVCNQTCQYALSISEKVRRRILFDAAYNSAFNKLYYYSYDAEIIFDLAMALINRAIQKDIYQMKKVEYIEYTIELAEFNYKDEVETYYQIASHTYLTQEAQI